MKVTHPKILIGLLASDSLALPFTVHAGNETTTAATKATDAFVAKNQGGATQATELMQAAKSTGQFNTWLTAVEKAGLSEMLKGGEYTVFAPTDDAFAKLPPGTLDGLLNNQAQLVELLKNHIIPQRFQAGDVPLGKVRSLAGQALDIDANRRHQLKVENAEVVVANILASNGLMHGIDQVLVAN